MEIVQKKLKQNNKNNLIKISFWKTYFNFLKSGLVFVLFSLFNGILPIIICLFTSMVKPFGTQYTMAIGYITAIQLGFLQLGWTIILTFIYSFKRYINQFEDYDKNKNEFITFSLLISLIYSLIATPLFFGSSYIYNMYASNHLNTILGQQQAFYFIYIAWLFTFFSSFVSTLIINLQIFKSWIHANITQLIYMILTVLFAFIFTYFIPLSNLNNSITYKQMFTGLFLAIGLSIGAILSFILIYIYSKEIIKFKLIKIVDLKQKLKFHLKNSWKTLLVILTIQIIKAICLIGIGLGLQDSVDGLVPLSYQMTRVIWYNILYLLPFIGYGLADAIYFYGFTNKIDYVCLTKILITNCFFLVLIYIPYGIGIFFLVDPLVKFYMQNVDTNLMLEYNLINLNSVNLPYLMNTMLKKQEYLEIVQNLADPNKLRIELEQLLFKPTNTNNNLVNIINKKWNEKITQTIINPICNIIPPYFIRFVDPSTRMQAINELVNEISKTPKILLTIKKLFFSFVQANNPQQISQLILVPNSGTFLYLSSWCLLYPLGLMLFKGSIAIRQHDIDTSEMLLNLFAQCAVIASVVAFGVELQYTQLFWMYNAWSFPLFITSVLAILYYGSFYIITYKKTKKIELNNLNVLVNQQIINHQNNESVN